MGEGVAGWAGACGVVVGDLDEDLVEVLDDVFDVLCFCDGELVGGWFGWAGRVWRGGPWTICRSGFMGAIVVDAW